MTTTAQALIDAAIASSLANDAGRSDLANDTSELLNVLNRKLADIYTLAALPPEYGGLSRGDYFGATTTVTLGASFVALPTSAFRHTFTTSLGVRVAVVPQADLDDGLAELPPAVVVQGNTVKGAGRSGDPGNGATLTVAYTPPPGTLTLGTHYIGATTPTDASTSRWPEGAGNPFLVAWLARYLALKAGDREEPELGRLESDLSAASQTLGTILGVAATRLADSRSGA